MAPRNFAVCRTNPEDIMDKPIFDENIGDAVCRMTIEVALS